MNLATLQHAVARALTCRGVSPDLDVHALTLAGELLVAKRRGEAAGWLPRTVNALGSSFRPRFAVHARERQPSGWNHPRSDAISFAETLIADRTLAGALRDLARFEQAQARSAQPCPFVIALRFPRHSDQHAAPPTGLHLWWRWHRQARLRYLRVPLP
jgi:hypothetical protein